jgi:spore coat polysaccharide biosynthesis predicted glycosyltransferase SpsG
MDDNGHAGHYSADVVVNQNAHATENLYQDRESYTQLLLGPRYAMLRKEFSGWGQWQRRIPGLGQKVLVTLGGSDPDNVTLRVLEGLQSVSIEGMEATVVVGGSNPHLASLERSAAKSKPVVRIVTNTTNMPELMAQADMAIAGAGATCWEMCFLGLPALLIDLAPNQLPIAQRLDTLGAGKHIGGTRELTARTVAEVLEWVARSAEVRQQMSRLGRGLVDGQGASRVVNLVQNFADGLSTAV